jgi:hypothetical protein
LSPVVGVPRVTPVAVHAVLVVASTCAGAVIVGFTLSVTVKVLEQVAELLFASVTVNVIVVIPVPTSVPAAGLCVTVTVPQPFA